MQIVKPDVNINFVGRRKIAYIISLVVILASILSLVLHGGPKYGIDFAGGAEALVQFDGPVTTEQINRALDTMGLNAAVQEYDDRGAMDYYRIVVAADASESENLARDLEDGLETHTQVGATLESFEMVGPQVGRDMREKALLAMFFALLFITVYISGRFELKWLLSAGIAVALALMIYLLRLIHMDIPMLMAAAVVLSLVLFWVLKLKYAMGAIVALLHDVVITAGVFSIFGKEFTLPIVAALLTIIGYSLNDTIIVFDRIRENLRKLHKRPLNEIVNRSINETLNRTLLTSGTTLVVVLSLFFLGGGIIHDFAFALLVGICVGTYSSIFVASPILLAWQRRG
ncbi:protein translocase subunit SecF [Desulfatitalea alkaliphila]|uniref:Protein-export membrane protein SecF n=1 Tax=Desulfatitalea alkaliphila TaxID=2929485 RepID=A0AA41UK10_9BACT|nr:protein translocase subunit SecF [Desulfatitalea alkaliphila]MCJ8502545.1 protein translocase subunit SecF [Desulfatitalea alkaliphila]